MDEFTVALLKLFGERYSLSICDVSSILGVDPVFVAGPPIAELRDQGYLIIFSPGDNASGAIPTRAQLQITQKGKGKLFELRKEAEVERSRKLTDLRSWIALGISAAALITAIVVAIIK